MQVIGFNFSKISGIKDTNFEAGPINTNIEFTDLQKQKVSMISGDALKVFYKFDLDYLKTEEKKDDKLAHLTFEGNIILSVDKEEHKLLTKAWKKKQLPIAFRIPLFNLILKKTAPKALLLQDELNIPSHVPIQQLQASKKDE